MIKQLQKKLDKIELEQSKKESVPLFAMGSREDLNIFEAGTITIFLVIP